MNLQSIDAAASPEVQMNENFETIDFASAYGLRQSTSSGLTWGYYGARWGGTSVAAGTLALTNAADNYIVVNRGTGAISVSTATTNWNNLASYARVYKVTTAGSVVTAIEDHRTGPGGIFGGGAINVNTTPVGNVGSGEDDLMTYLLAASVLSAAKKGVKIKAWGTFANNVNAKTLKLYFGSAVILTTAFATSVAGIWRIEAEVVSTGTDTQEAVAQLVTTGTAGAAVNDTENSQPTQDDGAAITIKLTGTATSNDDIQQRGLLIETF